MGKTTQTERARWEPNATAFPEETDFTRRLIDDLEAALAALRIAHCQGCTETKTCLRCAVMGEEAK